MVHVRGALAVVLLAVVLTACNDAPEPKVEDQPSPSSTPTAASSAPTSTPTTTPTATGPAEPTLPAAAQEDSDAGAEAFLVYFVDLFNYAQATGHTTQLASVSTADCAACQAYVSSIDEIYAAGGSVDGGQLSFGRVRRLPLDYGAEWAGFARGESAAQVIHRGEGANEEHGGAKLLLFAYTDWDGTQWRMRLIKTPTPT